jgi:hypothetical protein
LEGCGPVVVVVFSVVDKVVDVGVVSIAIACAKHEGV